MLKTLQLLSIKRPTMSVVKTLIKAYIISVNMGYGHQRTAFVLKDLALNKEIINANDYSGIPKKDKVIWETIRKFYEFISRFSRIPLIGGFIFSLYDRFQRILYFYPKKDLSDPNFGLKRIYLGFKMRWGKHLIMKLKDKYPLISTFFIPAFMAEFFNYPGKIYCVICDADIARTWAPLNPKQSKIRYFAPTERVVERLKLYGVKKENIFLTGYPLPLENIGEEMEILKQDLKNRLLNLDPKRKYFEKYKTLIETNLGQLPKQSDHVLTLMFSIGGAGVQKEIGMKILKSLDHYIRGGQIKIILSIGTKKRIKKYFEKEINEIDKNRKIKLKEKIEILYEENIENYFQRFNQTLRKTDILWTKPSELSFYSALGIPIIIAPPIGSQEEFNMRWLLKSGFGIFQENPKYTRDWFFDWLEKGYLAEMAMESFIESEKLGTLNIQKIIFNKN